MDPAEEERKRKEEAGWSRRGRKRNPAMGLPFGGRGGSKPAGAQPGANADHVPVPSDQKLIDQLLGKERPPETW